MKEKKEDNLSAEDEERLTDLFNKLDVDKDGKISLTDLAKAMKAMNVAGHHKKEHVEVCTKLFIY